MRKIMHRRVATSTLLVVKYVACVTRSGFGGRVAIWFYLAGHHPQQTPLTNTLNKVFLASFASKVLEFAVLKIFFQISTFEASLLQITTTPYA
ncbi:hypothetical protein GGU11DRAFT_767552 [Lentinula aff. detonsa]|nr:hypothetical protein GGU11DRAFT_767552 [Lentinula aff. detonsa]